MTYNKSIKTKLFITIIIFLYIIDTVLENIIFPGKASPTTAILIIVLMLFYSFKGKNLSKKKYQYSMLAFLFAVIGNIFIYLGNWNKYAFFYVLLFFIAFNISLTIGMFHQWERPAKSLIWSIPVLFITYAVFIYTKLYPNLGVYNIPIILYIVSILFMVMTVLGRTKKVSDLSYILVILGTALYAISNTLFAADKYYIKLSFSHFYISTTYTASLILIFNGFLSKSDEIL